MFTILTGGIYFWCGAKCSYDCTWQENCWSFASEASFPLSSKFGCRSEQVNFFYMLYSFIVFPSYEIRALRNWAPLWSCFKLFSVVFFSYFPVLLLETSQFYKMLEFRGWRILKLCHHLPKLRITFHLRKAEAMLVILSVRDLEEVQFWFPTKV